ncbi:O-antigen ligase family protein [Vibrio methylphosphonaticus]|uniref:O-antigen ligase family protein n=1 Tax=Vibrio methylphosphonaticus TaxID=2946866 RepID=UPI00202AC110|nr:O-antigen ligase family protein [Vibrio methylphosphonaticus]MCL9775441.1 O-antigen ligase family protein [Vibrio methylphosphonaticus]
MSGLALSLGVSKAGVGIFTILTLLLMLVVIVQQRANVSFYNTSSVNKALISLFFVGVFCSLLSDGGVNSAKDFVSKGSMLLLLPVCLFCLEDRKTRTNAFYFFIFGSVIACIYSLYLRSLMESGEIERIASFWDLGRWGEFLCYALAMFLPLLFGNASLKVRLLYGSVFFLLLFTLLISGMRGALLGISLVLAVYFSLLNRRYLPYFIVFSVFFGVVTYLWNPSVIENSITSFVSIFDLQNNLSNLARFSMWSHGIEYFLHNLSNDWRLILFGSGFENLIGPFSAYLESTNQMESYMNSVNTTVSLSDLHNAFFNVLNRMGVIYLLVMSVGLYAVCRALWSRYIATPNSAWLHSAMLIIMSFLVIGVFYSNELNYQTLMAAFMCCLAIRFSDAEASSKENQHV